VQRKIQEWREKLPWVQFHYAVKANPSSNIIHDLANAGGRFDVASANEMKMLCNLGISPLDMIYSNVIKEPFDLIFAS